MQLAIWEGDLNQYVLEEGDESFEFSVRLNAQHVLQEISSNFGPAAAEAISTAAHARLEEAERLRAAAHSQWWKCREAGLLALGILAEDLQGFEEAQATSARLILPSRCSFPASDSLAFSVRAALLEAQRLLVDQLLQRELAEHQAEPPHPCLHSRCLVAAAQACQAGCTDAASLVLQAAGRGLSAESPMVKLSSCRAVNRLVPCLKQGGEDGLQCLATFALPLLQGLCSLLPEAQEDMLHLLFDSMIVAVGANAPATAAMEPVLTPLLVQVWGSNLDDPMITGSVMETLRTMAHRAESQCAAQVCTRLLPQVCSMIGPRGAELPEGAMESAVDLLTILVSSGSCSLQTPGLEEAFVLVTRLSGADGPESTSVDHSVLQNGAECVRVFVQTMPDQVAALQVAPGVTGLHRCVGVVSWLLSANVDDSAAMLVGPLVTALIRHCGHILESVVTEMLRALVARLRTAHMPSFIEALLIVLAHITNQQGAPQMIEFLCACEPDTLALVTGLWIEQLPYMIRPYHVKVCCAALGAVCATRDARVLAASVQVKVEAAESGDSVSSRTRSKGGGERTASVALPQAAMRELVRAVGRDELAQQERAQAGQQQHYYGDEDEGEDGDGWADEGGDEMHGPGFEEDGQAGLGAGVSTFASADDFDQFERFLAAAGDDFDYDDEEEDDADDAKDGLFHAEVSGQRAPACPCPLLTSGRRVHRAQLKPIVGEHARAVHGLVGTDGFAQECSLLDAKGAPPPPSPRGALGVHR